MVSECHKSWAAAAGATFAEAASDADFEIAPAVSYDGEGLEAVCAGKGVAPLACENDIAHLSMMRVPWLALQLSHCPSSSLDSWRLVREECGHEQGGAARAAVS